MIGQLMLSLSILIVLHELGHFVPARLFNTRVEKFYLFFDAWFPLFKYKYGETEYGIGWLPLGGYVKIAGMIDESLDTESLQQEPQPWEFRSKPAWQRLIIMLGGVTVNFILGFFIFAMVLFVYGEEYLPAQNAEYGIHADSLGQTIGLQSGDKIVSINNKPFEKFEARMMLGEIIFNDAKEYQVERNGRVQTIPVPATAIGELSSKKNKGFFLFRPRLPFVVAEVPEDAEQSPGRRAGLKEGDKILALDGIPTPFYDNFTDLAKERKGQQVKLTYLRNERDTMQASLTLTENGKLGVYSYDFPYFFDTERQEYSLLSALPAGTKKGINFLANQIKAFASIFQGKISASDSLGGFKSIGGMFGTEWIWERFWTMTAILSLILAFMNLLPIPALDGGHVVFLLYEMVTGQKPSDKFLEYATIVGFIIVLSLVLFANINDFL